MKPHDFDAIVNRRMQLICSILMSKAREYASDSDRLHNFKVAARLDNETPEKALWGMLKKHLVSVRDMVHQLDNDSIVDIGMWDEKLGDFINYLILLEGLVNERKGK